MPAIVTPSSVAWVKSTAPSRPGGWTCSKYTSWPGPWSARQSRTRRWSVRSWLGPYRVPCRSATTSSTVVASSTPASSAVRSGTISCSHTPANGSGRVRQLRGVLPAEGSGPRAHVRAVRTLIPAAAAAASWVFLSIRFCLSNRTCASETIRPSPGADPRTRRQDGANRQK